MAQIDASIPLQVQRPRVTSPLEQYAQLEQLRGLQGQGQLREMQMQEFQDKRSRDQARRQIMAQGLRGEALAAALEQGGYLDDASGIRKQMSESEKSRLDLAAKKLELRNQLLQGVLADPQEKTFVSAARQYEAISGEKLPDEFYASIYELRNDPAQIKRVAAGLVMKPEQLLPKTDTRDIGGQVIDRIVDPITGLVTQTGAIDKTVTPDAVMTDKRAREEGAANRAVTVRGQNLTDARARETAAREAEKLKFEREQGKASDIQWDSDRGVLINKRTKEVFKPEGISGSMPKLTEGQAKAFMFGNRALEADRIISGMVDKNGEPTYSPMAINAKEAASNVPLVGGALGYVANKAIGDNEQKVEQAQRDFINAVLRQESGAVISPEEFNNARKQYFPQPGDSKAVIEQKTRNRQRAIEGFKVGAGPASGMIGDAPNTVQTDSLPDPAQYPGAVMRDDQTGMRYQSDGKSWRRL